MTLAYGAHTPCDEAEMLADHGVVRCPERDKPWVLATAILGSSLAFIEGSVVSLALPSIQSDLRTTSGELQWVVNAYLLVLGAFMLIGGSAGDRFGLRRVFVIGTGVFALGSALCAFAPGLAALVAARAVQGAGAALLVPTSLALISTHFEERERGRAIGTWAAASALTTALGPVLGGWLVDTFSWSSVFLVVPPLAALAIALALWRVPPARARAGGRLDYLGALLLALALGLLIYALVAERPATLRAVLALGGLAAGAAFVRREQVFEAPMLPLELLRSPVFSGVNLTTLLLYAALGGALFFLPFNLIQVQGYSALQAGAAFLPMTLMLGLGSRLAGDLLQRVEPRRVLTIGPALAGMGFAALALPGAEAGFASGFLPAILLIGAGMTVSVAPLTTVVMNAVPDARAGVASGVNNTAARLAGVLAVAGHSALAIGLFAPMLAAQLAALPLAAETTSALLDEAHRLAELGSLEVARAPGVGEAIRTAFVSAFRGVALLSGALALLGAAVAWVSLRPARR